MPTRDELDDSFVGEGESGCEACSEASVGLLATVATEGVDESDASRMHAKAAVPRPCGSRYPLVDSSLMQEEEVDDPEGLSELVDVGTDQADEWYPVESEAETVPLASKTQASVDEDNSVPEHLLKR